ncbi:MAG: hypothetical protein LE180_06425 [Endomicrobium sp.]|uniref:hypothetical protein n=1 Tax=Candidatus Endomicrobiellum pyrsonymphae TaxID=1408203 RepID=UPI0035883B9D|nr:hypothetical protein [Endomicrobium sp.]
MTNLNPFRKFVQKQRRMVQFLVSEEEFNHMLGEAQRLGAKNLSDYLRYMAGFKNTIGDKSAMDDDFFKSHLKVQLEKVFKEDTRDGATETKLKNEEMMYDEIKELQEKIKRLEDAVTTFQSIEEKKDNGKITLPVENVGTADKNENH